MKYYNKVLKSRKIIFFLAFIFVAVGVFAYFKIPKQEFPEIDAPAAVITAVYPGASPETVKREVTDIIENKILNVDGYDYSNSISKNSVSIIVLRLDVKADIDKSTNKLRELIDQVKNELPEGVTEINIKTDLVDTADAYYILIDEKGSRIDSKLIDDIKYEMSLVDGITKIEVLGDDPQDIVIEVDINRANQLGLTMIDIYNAVDGNISLSPIGDMRINDTYINLNMDSKLLLEDLENIILFKNPYNSSNVMLKEVASIYFCEREGDQIIRYNNEKGVLFAVYFDESINILTAGNDLINTVDRIKLPENVVIFNPHFSPEIIKNSIGKFSMSLLIGILLVMLVVFWGMGIRNAIVVSTAIPLTVMMTFAAMYFGGIRLHQISIAALIISLGM
ncbi:MAG: efflux RND transporter permease subunit [Clostridiales bacterium]|nr:efflux RND transporter permease subunit [Clostridiales bacterium]